MRKINKWISLITVVLFVIHLVIGAFVMLGIMQGGTFFSSVTSYLTLTFAGIHTIIGIILTIDTLRISKKSGASYPKENKLFWTRRLSGFALIVLILLHMLFFTNKSAEYFRLRAFGTVQIIFSMLMVICLLIHIITNIKPLFIGLGSKKIMDIIIDILIVTVLLCLFAGVAFAVYYYRWNLIWR